MSQGRKKAKVLVFAPEPISERLAGPNIRSIEFARQLARHFDTTLAVVNQTSQFEGEAFKTRIWSRSNALKWLGDYDVAVSYGMQYPARGTLRSNAQKPAQVFDLYDPLLLEELTTGKNADRRESREIAHLRRLTALVVKRADYIVCSTPRQRDLWFGALYVLGRIEPHRQENSAEDYVGMIPFGHNGQPPLNGERALKGVLPGIEPDDKVILWGGGIWNWFDPLTLIRAMAEIDKERGGVKLFFMGTKHPNQQYRRYEMVEKSRALATELNLLNKCVFFNEDSWVPFERRANYLLEADLAVCTAPEGPENNFSFRTRLVDAVWAGTPIVCTRGGFMADFVEANDIGLTARGNDVQELKGKILAALDTDAQTRFRANIASSRDQLRWDECVEPLIRFCKRVEEGKFQRPTEPFWKPWMDFAAYKVPRFLENLLPK